MQITGFYDEQDWYGEVRVDGHVLDPKPSQRVRNHSPDGFSWGYHGSGCAQLALALLLHAGIDTPVAIRHYQTFKREFVATWPRDSFTAEIDIVGWVRDQQAQEENHVEPA